MSMLALQSFHPSALPPPVPCLVRSPGGVGSTQLGNFLTQAGLTCNLLTDQDAIRHVNRSGCVAGCVRVL
jgi:hypothetical protein